MNSSWRNKISIWYYELMRRSCVVQLWTFYCYYLNICSLCTSKSLDNSVAVLQWPHKIFHLMRYTTWSSVIQSNDEWVDIKSSFTLRPTVICIIRYCVFNLYIFQYLITNFTFILFFFVHHFIFDFYFRLYIFIMIP